MHLICQVYTDGLNLRQVTHKGEGKMAPLHSVTMVFSTYIGLHVAWPARFHVYIRGILQCIYGCMVPDQRGFKYILRKNATSMHEEEA